MPNRTGFTLPEAEPALVRGVVIVLALLASAGIGWAADVSPETITNVALVLGFLVPLLQALWTRYATVPNAKVVARVSKSQGAVVAGDAAVVPTGRELVLTGEHLGDSPVLQDVTVRPELLHNGHE